MTELFTNFDEQNFDELLVSSKAEALREDANFRLLGYLQGRLWFIHLGYSYIATGQIYYLHGCIAIATKAIFYQAI